MISEKRKRELEKVSKGIQSLIPANISIQKEFLPNGQLFYVYIHTELGNLGRMFILPNGNESQYMFDVMGEEDDPVTEKKKKIFIPLSQSILNHLEQTLGNGKGTMKHTVLPSQVNTIKAEHITCKTCDSRVALIVYADNATTEAELANHATIFFKKAKELDVPTWVLGKEMVSDGDSLWYHSLFLTLKMWPKREKARILTEMEIDDILCPLVEYHCDEEDQ